MSQRDDTVHHHQQVDEGPAGLADDPDQEEVDGEDGDGSESQESREVVVEVGIDGPRRDDFQIKQILSCSHSNSRHSSVRVLSAAELPLHCDSHPPSGGESVALSEQP